jgi:mercuric ion transport protein
MSELMRWPTDADEARQKVTPGLLATGGVLAALGASSCCVLPFLLFTLGIGGAWIGNLTALAPYQPIFVAAAVAFLGFGFWRVYRGPKAACADDSYCARPAANRLTKAGLISATVLVVAAVSFNVVVPLAVN